MADFYLSSGDRISVDSDVLPLIEGQSWHRDSKGTVARSYRENGQVKRQTLHALLERHLGIHRSRGEVLTHLDDDWRNFRAENLRVSARGAWLYRDEAQMSEWRERGVRASAAQRTPPQLTAEGFKYRGVHKAGNKFKALATVNGRQTYLGLYATPEEAALAYDWALQKQGLEAVNRVGGELPEAVIRKLEARVA